MKTLNAIGTINFDLSDMDAINAEIDGLDYEHIDDDPTDKLNQSAYRMGHNEPDMETENVFGDIFG